ncbi:MAG: ferritin-like domain-containing protein [Polyangiaceae bacterium]
MRRYGSVDSVATALLGALGMLGGCGGSVAQAGSLDGGGGSDATGARGVPSSPTSVPTTLPTSAPTAPAMTSTAAPAPVPTNCSLHPCANPAPIVLSGVDTGFDTCQGGTVRRRAVADCPNLLPRASGGVCTTDAGDGIYNACTADSDCTEQPYGTCGQSLYGGCSCSYGCLKDSDCVAQQVCLCGDPVGTCVYAGCTSASACEPGCDCFYTGSGGFTCQTPVDTCYTDADCDGAPTTWPPGATNCPGSCSCGYSGVSVCAPQSYGQGFGVSAVPPGNTCQPGAICGTGRPFLVHGVARVAERVMRRDWQSGVRPDLAGLSVGARAQLATYWSEVGLMEHASIAAFARFALQLLALGAPPDLIVLSHQAMADETEHARLAFSLASAYGGVESGPGALAIAGAFEDFDSAAFVATLVREGCIGETVAAVEASEALQGAQDPAVRTVLGTIARDELRHAELAWKTLAWCVASARVEADLVRDQVSRGLCELRNRRRQGAEDMAEHGVLGASAGEALRQAAASHVIERCARALLGHSEQERAAAVPSPVDPDTQVCSASAVPSPEGS